MAAPISDRDRAIHAENHEVVGKLAGEHTAGEHAGRNLIHCPLCPYSQAKQVDYRPLEAEKEDTVSQTQTDPALDTESTETPKPRGRSAAARRNADAQAKAQAPADRMAAVDAEVEAAEATIKAAREAASTPEPGAQAEDGGNPGPDEATRDAASQGAEGAEAQVAELAARAVGLVEAALQERGASRKTVAEKLGISRARLDRIRRGDVRGDEAEAIDTALS